MEKESREEKQKIEAYISEITFNNGESLSIAPNDIVLFVGPNNAGKSQSLRDIYVKCGSDQPTIVVSKVETEKSEGSLLPLLNTVSKLDDRGSYIHCNINGQGVNFDKANGDGGFLNQSNYGDYRDLFISHLTTETRLNTCVPVKIINRSATWTDPIHYAAFDYKYGKWLSENFHKAFANDLTANPMHGATIPLCIGPMVKLPNNFENETERQAEYAHRLGAYKQVQTQGDGIKSFTGILLHLMLNYYCTYLIDEPESFLHPPQARIMGQIIGQTLRDNQQAFISTHSEEVVKGLLDVCEERLKIVRITRNEDNNSFSILDNQRIKDVFGDPLLKYSNIMSGLFHKTVVLCESDSDCKLYSAIESHLKQKRGMYSEVLFIHCGGKQRMAKTASALRSLDIDVRLIPDMDVLNDENTIKEIATEFGVDWDDVKTDYNIFSSNLHSSKETINRNDARSAIVQLLDKSHNDTLSKNEIKEIREIIKTTSKWDGIKHSGKRAIPSGEPTNAYNRMEKIFREHHIYLVPVGELEGFVKEVGGHGPAWVNDVLEQYSDLDDSVYSEVSKFICDIGL